VIEPPTAGELTIDGIDARAARGLRRRRLRRSAQMVFQDPYGSLNPRRTVAGIVGEGLAIAGELPRRQRREIVLDMLDRVGLGQEHAQRYPHMLSGGQRQRVAIARALVMRPKLVVADEPTSALDLSIQAQVLNLLLDLQEEFGVAYLFVSHDLPLVRHIADDILVLYLGRVMEQGAAEAVFQRPRHPYTRALLDAVPSVCSTVRPSTVQRGRLLLRGEPSSPIDPPSGCVFHLRCPHATPLCVARRPELRRKDGRLVACHLVDQL
jgi:dipeptide transport system ATP-binding protein